MDHVISTTQRKMAPCAVAWCNVTASFIRTLGSCLKKPGVHVPSATSFDSLRATGLTGRSNWGGMGIGSRNASKISSRKCHNRWRLLTDNNTRSCLMSWSQRQQVSLPTWMPHWVSLPTMKGFLAEWIGSKTIQNPSPSAASLTLIWAFFWMKIYPLITSIIYEIRSSPLGKV